MAALRLTVIVGVGGATFDPSRAIETIDDAHCRLYVRLSPGASQNRITGLRPASDGRIYLAVQITQGPEKGKANKALIALLAKQSELPKSKFALQRGATDRSKQLIVSCTASRLCQSLSR